MSKNEIFPFCTLINFNSTGYLGGVNNSKIDPFEMSILFFQYSVNIQTIVNPKYFSSTESKSTPNT